MEFDIKDFFQESANEVAKAVYVNDDISKEKAISKAVIGGMKYLAKQSTNKVDDTLIALFEKAL